MAFLDFLKPLMIKAPELTYFDHLAGEFESLETALASGPAAGADALDAPLTSPPDAAAHASPDDAGRRAAAVQAGGATRRVLAEAGRKVASLRVKRENEAIDWNDLYLLEMLLTDLRPVGALRGKVLSLRRDYRSVAGQVEYDEYLASKPKNLLDPPDPRDPPDTSANYEQLLRDDLKDLLGRLFKRYAFLPVREARLKRLTTYASLFCGLFLILLIGFILMMDQEKVKPDGPSTLTNTNAPRRAAAGPNSNSNDNRAAAGPMPTAEGGQQGSRWKPWPSIALFVVLVSGAMGGFVSALQRVQSSPTEGDSVYNLAMLYHGSYAVFVAPLSGTIFSILLYMMFTGGILEGRFFPVIYTPPAKTDAAKRNTNGNANAGRNANTRDANNANTSNLNTSNANTANANSANSNAGNGNGESADDDTGGTGEGVGDGAGTETAAATPTPQQVPSASLGVRDFLYKSGPAGGEDYALLIIWSFIAGFAERFVPDSLNRLIANK